MGENLGLPVTRKALPGLLDTLYAFDLVLVRVGPRNNLP